MYCRRLMMKYQSELIGVSCLLSLMLVWMSVAYMDLPDDHDERSLKGPNRHQPAVESIKEVKVNEAEPKQEVKPKPEADKKSVILKDGRPWYPDLRFRALRIHKSLLSFVDQIDVQDVPMCHGKVKGVLYLKANKADSDPLLPMVRRFGLTNNLSFALPVGFMKNSSTFGWPWNFDSEQYVYPSPNKLFNIFCEPAIFSPESQLRLLPPETHVVVSVQEPFEHTLSAFDHYDLHQNILFKEKHIKFEEFLYDLQGYDDIYMRAEHGCIPRGVSVVQNAQARNLGFPLGLQGDLDMSQDNEYIMIYLKRLSKSIDIPVVAEHYDESLMLLKRAMCWEWKDILQERYVRAMDRLYEKKPIIHDTFIENARNWNHIDSLIYRLMNRTLWTNIERLGERDFMEEVAAFRKTRDHIVDLCNSQELTHLIKMDNIDTINTIPSNQWDSGFKVTYRDCYMIQGSLVNELKTYVYENKFGYYDTNPSSSSVPGC